MLGTPADALCAVAEQVGAELIVVGNKGEDASFALRRSISEQVAAQGALPGARGRHPGPLALR